MHNRVLVRPEECRRSEQSGGVHMSAPESYGPTMVVQMGGAELGSTYLDQKLEMSCGLIRSTQVVGAQLSMYIMSALESSVQEVGVA